MNANTNPIAPIDVPIYADRDTYTREVFSVMIDKDKKKYIKDTRFDSYARVFPIGSSTINDIYCVGDLVCVELCQGGDKTVTRQMNIYDIICNHRHIKSDIYMDGKMDLCRPSTHIYKYLTEFSGNSPSNIMAQSIKFMIHSVHTIQSLISKLHKSQIPMNSNVVYKLIKKHRNDVIFNERDIGNFMGATKMSYERYCSTLRIMSNLLVMFVMMIRYCIKYDCMSNAIMYQRLVIGNNDSYFHPFNLSVCQISNMTAEILERYLSNKSRTDFHGRYAIQKIA